MFRPYRQANNELGNTIIRTQSGVKQGASLSSFRLDFAGGCREARSRTGRNIPFRTDQLKDILHCVKKTSAPAKT
jgi:hypothetical protein